MSARTPLLAFGLSLVAALPAAAKPPGLPADPLPNGQERTPVELEFHLALPGLPPLAFALPWPGCGTRAPLSPAQLEAWRALNRLPVDLLGLALPRIEWY
jgi:hypothetical protein